MPRLRIERRPPGEATGLPDSLHPLLRRLYAARGVRSAAELDPSLASLCDFQGLLGLQPAVELVAACLREDRRILIVGDFDADGATSSALGVRALRKLGAQHVDYLVPNRFEYGYGLTPEIVELAATRHPDLIVTVDNGISSHAGVLAAHRAGIRVLVTDHHVPGASLPEADAILNPNLPGDAFPSKCLAGVGVMFYLLLALRSRLRTDGWFVARGISEPRLAEFLDIVALGTVADLVPLDHNNRVLVAQGLARMRAGRGIPGIQALLEVARRAPARLSAADLAFGAAPRLNAAGRLTDMSLGIELLLTDDAARARSLAVQLDELNHERRAIEAGMQQEALAALASMGTEDSDASLPFGVCLFRPEWHQGVVGLVAARVKERVHRPVIAFARAGEGSLKGSARSVRGLHLRDTLEAVDTRHPGLIEKFGGHAMAAGLSLREEKFPEFAAAFDAEVHRRLNAEDLRGVILSDGELPAEYLTLECAELLQAAGPWGQGFPEPVFDGEFIFESQRVVGAGHLRMQLRALHVSQPLVAIAFRQAGALPAGGCARVHIVYRPGVDEYGGERRLQLLVEHVEPVVP
ncbi:MAG: single-stranded-DNA-specific exonuclease RecJ [Gammaproteobacteria bacterium]